MGWRQRFTEDLSGRGREHFVFVLQNAAVGVAIVLVIILVVLAVD